MCECENNKICNTCELAARVETLNIIPSNILCEICQEVVSNILSNYMKHLLLHLQELSFSKYNGMRYSCIECRQSNLLYQYGFVQKEFLTLYHFLMHYQMIHFANPNHIVTTSLFEKF